MRYLSVCSGIEAATVAWHNLGWTPVGFSEIEPFPSAVLAHHYPHVPNYGDMTKHKEWPLGPGSVDLLVGGTPCQSFSVAGLRRGLSDPRGGLMLTYLEIAQRLRPKWIVWENVPGVLSSNGGRDFGSFLGALAQLRYGFAYRVLDAQYCRVDGRWPKAVPQRRRRVFVVGCDLERDPGGRERAAEVLALGTGLRWHLAESGKARKAAPADAEASVGAGCWWDGSGCAGTLTKQNAGGAQRMPDKDNFGAIIQPETVRSGGIGNFVQDDVGGTIRANGGDYAGGSESLVMSSLNPPIPFTKAKRAQSVTDDETWVNGKVNPTLSLFDQGDTRATTVAVAFANRTRDGIKVPEVMADGIVPALTNPGDGGRSDAINVAVAFTPGNLTRGAGPSPNADVAPTQRCSKGRGADDQRTCVAFSSNMSEPDFQTDGSTPTVKVGSGLGIPSPPAVAFTRCDNGQDASVEVTPTMRCGSNYSAHPAVAHALRGEGFDASEDGTGRGTPIVPVETLQQQGYNGDHASTQEANAIATLRVLRDEIGEEAFAAWGLGVLDSLQPSQVLRSCLHGLGIRCATFSRSWPIDCAISRPEDRSAWAVQSVREAQGEGCPPQGWQLPEQLAAELGAYLSKLSCPGPQAERLMHHLWCVGEGVGILRQALSKIQEARRPVDASRPTSENTMTVRRLTATECEFLQGFPRNYTLIPWRKKPAADCPDGPRYKALGNSMAVNCMAWIGERIAAVEAAQNEVTA